MQVKTNAQIQAQLHKLQRATGKTQTELGRLLDVSLPTINSWMNGKSQPRAGHTARIAELVARFTEAPQSQPEEMAGKKKRMEHLQKKCPRPLELLLSRSDIYESLLLSMTYHTNSIEGSTFNEPEVKAVLFDDVTIPKKTVREHQEVKNHQGALGFMLRTLREGAIDVTEQLVLQLHAILMNGILHNAGQYRTHSVRIAGSHVVTSNHLSIAAHMRELVREMNKVTVDSVAHIAATHARFEQIHPFSDGNGRVGRLLMVFLALRARLAPPLIEHEYKMAYYAALAEAQLHGRVAPLTSFTYDALEKGYALLVD